MTKRIFRSILGVSLVVLLASLVLIVGVLHGYFQDRTFRELESLTGYIAHGMEEMGTTYLTEDLPNDFRITWIDRDGTVLFDNRTDASQMENHSQREEIREALTVGRGHASHYSDTLSQQTLYVSQRLSDGTVLRVSTAQYSVWMLVLQALQPMAVIVVLALAFVVVCVVAGVAIGGVVAIGVGIVTAWSGFSVLFSAGMATMMFFCGMGMLSSGVGLLMIAGSFALGGLCFRAMAGALNRWLMRREARV